MDINDEKHKQANEILNNLFKEPSLRELFERRLHNLNLKQTTALRMIKMERKALLGIIDGTQRRTDYKNYEKLAAFLNTPTEELRQKHVALLEKNFEQKELSRDKKKFLREYFDLASLKKAGFINDVTDEYEIESKLNRFFGFNSIFEYEKRSFNALYSAPDISSNSAENIEKITLARDNWLTAGRQLAARLDNPYQYDREGLIKYFPQIRWYSTNVEFGLINVIKALFKFGITVIYQSPLSSLHLRGATIPVMGKPCILLTDHKGFYPTLWHGLVHELYHVLFDWLDIKSDKPHITEDTSEVLTITDREMDADNFAREFLFARKKIEDIKLYLRDQEFIEETAKNNDVHPSFIYTYYAFDYDKVDRMAWARAKRLSPPVSKAVYRLENPFNRPMPIEDFAKKLRLEIYN